MPGGYGTSPGSLSPTGQRPLQSAGGSVGLEFVGLAGALRRKVELEERDWRARSRALLRIFAPGRPKPTAMQLRQLRWQWERHMPSMFRLSCRVEIDRQGRLEIREERLMCSRIMLPNWTRPDERSLKISRLAVFAVPPILVEDEQTLITISQHALARRFQRGWRIEESAVLRDLVRLYERYPKVQGALGTDFTIDGAEGGWWGCNAMVGADGVRVLMVKMFWD